MNQQYNIDERLSYPISSIVIVPSSIESMKEWRKNDARQTGANTHDAARDLIRFYSRPWVSPVPGATQFEGNPEF